MQSGQQSMDERADENIKDGLKSALSALMGPGEFSGEAPRLAYPPQLKVRRQMPCTGTLD